MALHDHEVRPVFSLNGFVAGLCRAIRDARSRIYVDFYVLGGEPGLRIAEALIERHREGLDVRVLLDRYLGTFWPLRPDALPVKAALDAGGVPLRFSVTRSGGRIVRRRVADHNKLAVIDGRVTYVGGTNPTGLAARFEDLAVRVDGAVGAHVERQFLHDWALAGGRLPVPGRDVVFRETGLLEHRSAPGLSTLRLVGTGPGRRTFAGALVNAIDSTRRAVAVHVHQVNHDGAVEALIRAHRRGVDVRVVLDPIELAHYIPGVRHVPRATLNAITVRRLKRAGVPVRFAVLERERLACHMKLAVFDGRVLMTGTANWTRRATTVLTETVLEIAGGPAVDAVASWFEMVWRERTEDAGSTLQARLLDGLFRLVL